jgi:hypothetical protein
VRFFATASWSAAVLCRFYCFLYPTRALFVHWPHGTQSKCCKFPLRRRRLLLLTCPADKAGFHRVVISHSLASLGLAVS